MFEVVVCAWEAEKYIVECLKSVKKQTFKDWHCVIFIDPGRDKTAKAVDKWVEKANDHRFVIIERNRRRYLTENMLQGGMGCCYPETIIAFLDGDDRLYTPKALEIVYKYYKEDQKLLMTYGSYIKASTRTVGVTCNPCHSLKPIRKQRWRTSHLKTVKYKLFGHLKEKDLQNDKGEFFKYASDRAFMFPLMEMAGLDRCAWIHEPIYFYNDLNPMNADVRNRKEQRKCRNQILKKPALERLEHV